MKFDNGIYEETYRTSFSQTGIHDVLTNKSFLSLMENIAGAHSAYFHFSFADIMKNDLTWVILNWKLHVISRPSADELVTLKTWGRFANKVYVLRDFKMYDKNGNLCAIASSKWCLMNFSTGRIARIPENLSEIYHGFYDNSVFDISDLPRLSEPACDPLFEDDYKIRRFDLDINKHVHNLNYLNFAYELLPDDIFDGKELNNVEIAYKKELKYGQVIKSFLHYDNNEYTVVIKDKDEKVIHSIIKLYD